MYRESVRFVVIHAEICLLGSDACQSGLPHASCLMPRRHRDASAMRPSTDSYANDIMRRFQFREPGTGSATGTALRRSSGRIVMTDFNLTEFLHVILSLCHNSQRRRRRLGRMRKRGASNRTGVGVLKRRQVLPLPFRVRIRHYVSWECENAETRHIWRNLARNATQDEEKGK